MPRSAFAVLLVLAALIALPASVRAAEPEQEDFLDAATAAGLTCSENEPSNFTCDVLTEEHYWYSIVAMFDERLYLDVGRLLYSGEHQPVESDVLGLMNEYLRLLLDGDAETEAVSWLARMNGTEEGGALQVGDWFLAWLTVPGVPGDTASEAELTIEYLPADLASPSPTPRPADSAAALPSPIPPPSDWSPGGRSTYTGVWTITALQSDMREYDEADGLGSTYRGTLIVDCRGSDATCLVIDNGVEIDGEVLGDGVVRGVLDRERDIEMEECSVDVATVTTIVDVEYDSQRAIAVNEDRTEPRSCVAGDSSWYTVDATHTFEGVLSAYEPALSVPEASAGTAEEDGSAGGAAGAPGVETSPDARPFAASVPKPAEVSTDPAVLLQSAALAALLVFLMPFPSQLFNSTLEAHEDKVKRWLRLDRIGAAVGRVGAFWASWPGVALFTLLAAVLYGFLDPGFGLSLGSLATFLGMLLGIVLVTAAFAVPAVLAHRRHGDRPTFKVVPVSLLIGVACVLLSRLTDFQPGYLYGLLIGLAFARELSAAEEGRATAIGALVMLAVALVSWLGLGGLPEGDAFGLVVLRTSLAALMVAGLEGVVFGLLPMRFLPGEPLYAWNRVLWGALLAIGAFAFFHILINPASGYLSDSSRTPLFTVLALLIGFSAVSVAFWAWFRFRGGIPEDEPTSA